MLPGLRASAEERGRIKLLSKVDQLAMSARALGIFAPFPVSLPSNDDCATALF
jgi:hypothetical protein